MQHPGGRNQMPHHPNCINENLEMIREQVPISFEET